MRHRSILQAATRALLVNLLLVGCAAPDDRTTELPATISPLTPTMSIRLRGIVPQGSTTPRATIVSAMNSALDLANNHAWIAGANIQYTFDSTRDLEYPSDLGDPAANCAAMTQADGYQAYASRYVGVLPVVLCDSVPYACCLTKTCSSGEGCAQFSGLGEDEVVLSASSPNVMHESGHYFGLNHVHSDAAFDQTFFNRAKAVLSPLPSTRRQAAWTNLINTTFDGDGLSDTGPTVKDGIPAPYLFPAQTGNDTCAAQYQGKMTFPFGFTGTFTPERTNIVGYWRYCSGAIPGQYRISPMQSQIIQANLEARRRHLFGVALKWTPWQSIPGATARAVGAAPFNGELFLFSAGNAQSDFIYFNHAPAGQGFVGWDTVGGASDTPIAATSFGNLLYLFTKGDGADHNIYFNVDVPGQSFIGWNLVPGLTTDTALATAVFKDEIYFFAKGNGADQNIYFNSALTQQPWKGWRPVGGQTDLPLAAAPFDDKLYVFAHSPTANQYYVNIATTADTFPGWVFFSTQLDTNVSAVGALATASFGGRLYVFARGTDNRVYFNSALPQQPFGRWYPLPGGISTDATPAVASFNNQLWVIVKDLNNQFQYLSASAL